MRRHHTFLAILLFVLTTLHGTIACAQVAIDQTNPAPAWSCLNAGSLQMSQTFLPDFDRMNFADVYLSGGSSTSLVDGDFSVRILRDGTLVQESERLMIPAVPGSGSQYHRFAFDNDVNFVLNTAYELELVNHSNTSYFSWCQSQNNAYPGGAPSIDPPIGNPTADFLFRTGMQSIYTPLQPGPTGGDYVYYESAPAPTTPPTTALSADSNFFTGLNFSVERPTRISRLGASFGVGGQTVFGALFSATGFIDPPDSTDLSTADILATTLIDIPSRHFNDPPVEAFGEVDVVLQPGDYGVVFGSGLFGATGQTSLPSVDGAYGFQAPYTFRISDGMRFVSASDVRVVVEGGSLPGMHQARAAYDAEAQLYDGTWVIIDGERETRPDLFPFYDIDLRGLMEFTLDGVPEGAQVTSAKLELEPTQRTSNAQGENAEWVLHGFAGDGALDANTPTAPLNEVGRSGPIDTFDPLSIEIDATYVQSLVDQGTTHLGLIVRGGDNGLAASYANWESGDPDKIPLLSIEFSLPVDPDSDGDVDGLDFLELQRNSPGLIPDWQAEYPGAPPLTATHTVPEPTAASAVAIVLLMACACRRCVH